MSPPFTGTAIAACSCQHAANGSPPVCFFFFFAAPQEALSETLLTAFASAVLTGALPDHPLHGLRVLRTLAKVPRFRTALMFLSPEQRAVVRGALELLRDAARRRGGEKLTEDAVREVAAQYEVEL